MPICKYCEQEKKLCRAHIIPEAFYRKMYDDKMHPQLSKIKLGEKETKISPIGFYDTNILCSDCDNKIGKYDDYAGRFLRKLEKVVKEERIFGTITISTISGEHYEYLKLKKFFISLIYRASISQLKDFKNVSLGEMYENEAKLFLENTCDNHNFEIIIQKRTSDIYHSIDKMMLLFGKFKFEGINCYELMLAGYRIIMKVDKRSFPKKIGFLSLNPECIIMLHQKIEDSKDNDFMQAIIRKYHFPNKVRTKTKIEN